MKLFPYLKMHGNANQALIRYKNIFKGSIQRHSLYKNSPLANETNGDLVIHSQIHFGGNIICMADMISKVDSDTVKQQPNDQLFQLCINFDSEQLTQTQRIFEELSQNGQVLMNLEKTFWNAYYGKVKDSFGIVWSLNCDIKEEKTQDQTEQKQQIDDKQKGESKKTEQKVEEKNQSNNDK